MLGKDVEGWMVGWDEVGNADGDEVGEGVGEPVGTDKVGDTDGDMVGDDVGGRVSP